MVSLLSLSVTFISLTGTLRLVGVRVVTFDLWLVISLVWGGNEDKVVESFVDMFVEVVVVVEDEDERLLLWLSTLSNIEEMLSASFWASVRLESLPEADNKLPYEK